MSGPVAWRDAELAPRPVAASESYQSMVIGARSMNQLCGCTTPFTFADMARGPTSWAIQMNGASSTMRECSLASASSRALPSKVVRADSTSLSICSLPKKPQLFDTGGNALVLTKRTIAKNGSIAAKLTLMPWLPFCQLPEEDLKAIFAFLKTQPAVYNPVETHPAELQPTKPLS